MNVILTPPQTLNPTLTLRFKPSKSPNMGCDLSLQCEHAEEPPRRAKTESRSKLGALGTGTPEINAGSQLNCSGQSDGRPSETWLSWRFMGIYNQGI